MRGTSKRIQGTIKRHPDGFGFLIPTAIDHPDVFISRGDMVGIMTNDKVEIDVLPSDKKNKFFGKVIKILERGTTRIVGTFKKQKNGDGHIEEKTAQWGQPLVVDFKNSRSAVDGDLVAVEILQFPEKGKIFSGRVIEIIGDAADPLNDIKRIVHLHKLHQEFSSAALQEANLLADHVLPNEISGRQDLRDKPFITIDGVTAKDFDDAVLVSKNPKGFHLWVAIADVSHYVRMGSAIDDAAYERGTSTYFPNFVIPMLPEKLSNELCSLKPNVDRLAFVCEMQLNFQGEVESSDVYEAVIHSQARVTYGEAQDILSGDTDHKVLEVNKNIRCAYDLAKILMAKRFREGSLDLHIGETEVIVDDAGNPVDIIRSNRVFAHKLIEELMLIANVSVAKILNKANIPAIYRIHEAPDREDIDVVEKFLNNFGWKKKISGNEIQKKLTNGLQEFEGKPEGTVLSILTLRSMKQAKYSENNVGHFGLGFDFYTHFTSPIRRYPDLIVHRLLKSLKYPKYKNARIGEDKLMSAGTFLSSCEQRSVKAERQLISIKKARFMHKQLGNIFDGVISSVTKFGVFVMLREFDVDGLVKLDDLSTEPMDFDEENLLLRGKKSGKIFRIGDTITIQVASVNTEEGQIDFVLEGAKKKIDKKVDSPKSFLEKNKKQFSIRNKIKSSSNARLLGRRSKK